MTPIRFCVCVCVCVCAPAACVSSWWLARAVWSKDAGGVVRDVLAARPVRQPPSARTVPEPTTHRTQPRTIPHSRPPLSLIIQPAFIILFFFRPAERFVLTNLTTDVSNGIPVPLNLMWSEQNGEDQDTDWQEASGHKDLAASRPSRDFHGIVRHGSHFRKRYCG